MIEQSGKRAICNACQYPSKQCVCALLHVMDGPINVWILQDKREAKHAKNSARLFALCYRSTQVIMVTDSEAMSTCFKACSRNDTVLLYPSDEATPAESLAQTEPLRCKNVILLDGTWPKAKKMLFTEPRLALYQKVSFAQPPESFYDIRKSPNRQALATLEAASYFLECVVDLKFSVIRHTFKDIIALQWAQQPSTHKH